jgi:hypothetical protein
LNKNALRRFDLKKLILFKSLDAAEEQNFISKSEKATLTVLRQRIRNPFSHVEIKKILIDAPENFTGFMFNINDHLCFFDSYVCLFYYIKIKLTFFNIWHIIRNRYLCQN